LVITCRLVKSYTKKNVLVEPAHGRKKKAAEKKNAGKVEKSGVSGSMGKRQGRETRNRPLGCATVRF